ncbi:MAG TPA: sugar nucleotide-binding protein [Verrucomicrobiae bacterium]|jgi:dTDP-4-dehydrorhamnose reductase|nr:sugar nucleotide-binding protein [Verrucomicrobiae bacterium]
MLTLLLGATGYIGQAFTRELRRRGTCFIPLTRSAVDYTCFEQLFDYVRKMKPEFVINAAGTVGQPNVDACEQAREETLWGNTLLPQTVARVCLMTNTPWGHVSSGSIYTGAKLVDSSGTRIVRNLNQPEMRCLFELNPNLFRGFTERDEPNFSFRSVPCNFYSGTKALAEEAIAKLGENYIWRLQNPFNEIDKLPNLLSKLQRYAKVYDHVSSFSHLDDSVRACLDLWERHAPFGVYNVVNPGAMTTRQLVTMMQCVLKSDRVFEFWKDDEEFYREGAKAPRANCLLDAAKLQSTGIRMRPVQEAMEDSLERWQAAVRPMERRQARPEPLPIVG